jgi:galactose mutarotase-like enzyme
VSIALNGPTVSVSSSVRNLGHEDMPASIGYHPGFRWPLPYGEPRASHFIEFATDEGPSIRRLDGSGLVAAERHPTPVSQRRLPLQDSLFENDVVIFDDIRSRAVTYGSDKGPRIRLGFPDARFLGLWTRPGAGFICIEPWHGISDEAGFAGDFRDKWGVFTVPPGISRQLSMDITLKAE